MFRYRLILLMLCLLFASCSVAGQWYPGIIHSHDKIFSDGGNVPPELARIIQSELKKYRSDGKGFMIVTDHFDAIASRGLLSAYPAAIRDTSIAGQFVAIPGLELGSKWRPEANTVATSHILAIGSLPSNLSQFKDYYDRNGNTLTEKFDLQQEIINQITGLGMMAVAAHPSQLVIGGTTALRVDHRFNMQGGYSDLRGVEMFNVLGPGQEEESFQFYLRLVASGQPVFVTSGSDYHGTLLSAIPELALGALTRITWVYADNLTEDAILKAIAEGKTYAAQSRAMFSGGFLRERDPGFQVIGVDKPILTKEAYLQAERVEFIIYRDGQEVCRQKLNGDESRARYYELGEYEEDHRHGWLDPDATSTEIRTYVIRVMATKNGLRQTMLVTSPIRLRLRPAGLTNSFFDAIKGGRAEQVAGFLQQDPSLANERDYEVSEEEGMRYRFSHPLALSIAATLNNMEIFRLLLNAGASPDEYLGTDEPGPLMNVACTGNITAADLLLQHGADINICTDGNTALVWAIASRHSDLAKWLIEHNADINHPNDNGRRPLTIAKRIGLQDVVEALIAKGAKE